MDTDSCTTGQIVDGFVRGVPAAFFFFGCITWWAVSKIKDAERQMRIETERLCGFSHAKAGRRVSEEGLAIGRKLAVKERSKLSADQVAILNWYQTQALGTAQKIDGVVEHLPPDESGAWEFVPDAADGLHWVKEGGRVRSLGRTSSASPSLT